MPDYRFNAEKKLLGKNAYSSVFAGRKILHGKYFNLLYQKMPSDTSANNTAKLGLAIAKKHHKLAVTRNNLKRIVRETFRMQNLENYNVVVLSKSVKNIDNKELFKDISMLFAKLATLK